MMRQFDDPDQAVSIVAILLFVDAAFDVPRLLTVLFQNASALLDPIALLFVAWVAAKVAAGVGLLKHRRWAWPLAVATAGLGIVALLFALAGRSILPVGLFSILFYGLTLWLLFRPAVRERFGQR